MKIKKTGEQAFSGQLDWRYGTGGMTLRDYFAGQALMGLVASTDLHGTFNDYARSSFQYADAMIAERDKGEE
jgi:hypothetical protein